MECPKCKTKMKPKLKIDSAGKRYYEECPKCGYKKEIK